MWLEAVLGLCLGCELYGVMARRGWRAHDDTFEICANGACDLDVVAGAQLGEAARRRSTRRGRPRLWTRQSSSGIVRAWCCACLRLSTVVEFWTRWLRDQKSKSAMDESRR